LTLRFSGDFSPDGEVRFASARAADQDDIVSVFQERASAELAQQRPVHLAAGEVGAARSREPSGLELVHRVVPGAKLRIYNLGYAADLNGAQGRGGIVV
jgi:hypothetical protein